MRNRILKSMFNISVMLGMFSLGMCSGCASIKSDKSFDPYVRSFVKNIGAGLIGKTNISFRSPTIQTEGYITLGECHMFTGKVNINPEYWYGDDMSEKRKTALVYHELAHCAFLEDHDDNLLPDSCAKSLMHSQLPSQICLNRHWKHYIKELHERVN